MLHRTVRMTLYEKADVKLMPHPPSVTQVPLNFYNLWRYHTFVSFSCHFNDIWVDIWHTSSEIHLFKLATVWKDETLWGERQNLTQTPLSNSFASNCDFFHLSALTKRFSLTPIIQENTAAQQWACGCAIALLAVCKATSKAGILGLWGEELFT